jgi:hypothetical protein
MAFFKGVNLLSAKQEKLSGWINERHAAIGTIVRLKDDEFGRDWTVAEVGDQLVQEGLVDQRHLLQAEVLADTEAAQEPKRAARKLKAAAAAASEA